MTAKQALMLHALRQLGGGTSHEVADRMTVITTMADPAKARTFGNYDVVTIGKQLVGKQLVKEHGVKFGPKSWSLTSEGDGTAALLPVEPVRVVALEQVQPGDRLRWRGMGTIESGTVWTDPDGRAGHVMVEVDSVGGELMPVSFEVEGGLWKVGR